MSRIYKTFLENEQAIRRVFARRFRNADDIEDLTQEIFLKCFAAEAKAEINDPKSFLLRAAKNLAINESKKMFRATTDSIEDSGGPDVYRDEGQVSAEERLDSKRKLHVLAVILAELPPDYRRALLMRKMEKLKLAQIAMRLDISVRTAQKRVSRALEMCEAAFRQAGYDPVEFGAGMVPKEAGAGSRKQDKGEPTTLPCAQDQSDE